MIDELHITVDELCVGDVIEWHGIFAVVRSVGPIDDGEARRWYRVQPLDGTVLFTEYDEHDAPITKHLTT